MSARRSLSALGLALFLSASLAHAAPPPSPRLAAKPPARTERATFAMGCFWCAETQFEGQPGVLSVVSGYTGGPEREPTYEQVSDGLTGHYESIEVVYDAARTSYAKLLDLFWHGIDPTQGDGQFCDRGRQYRSAVFVHDAAQRRAAEDSKRAIERSGVLRRPIVTEVLDAGAFWPAEEYHQDYWRKDPLRYRSYRLGCGRDARLRQLWGKAAAKPLAH
jgi:peptide-methionine (S)-S-oxide reductase